MLSTQVTILSSESIEQFRNWCTARARSQNTVKAYTTDLRMMMLWSNRLEIPIHEMETVSMMWLNETRTTVSPKTTNRRLTSIRSFAKWAGLAGMLSDYIAPTPPKGQPHPLPNGMEDVNAMIQHSLNYEQRALIGLCAYTGLRLGEALAMKPNWLNSSTMKLTVQGKGDRWRTVPVSSRAWSAISHAFAVAMVGNKNLINYQDRSARKAITVMGEKAEVARRVSSHDLRATFATEVYNRTRDQRLVQELLGHANGATTEIYIGVSSAAMTSAVEF